MACCDNTCSVDGGAKAGNSVLPPPRKKSYTADGFSIPISEFVAPRAIEHLVEFKESQI